MRILRMNTVKIKYPDIRDFLSDLKRLRIRHKPFKRVDNYYEIYIYSDTKATFLTLKYA